MNVPDWVLQFDYCSVDVDGWDPEPHLQRLGADEIISIPLPRISSSDAWLRAARFADRWVLAGLYMHPEQKGNLYLHGFNSDLKCLDDVLQFVARKWKWCAATNELQEPYRSMCE